VDLPLREIRHFALPSALADPVIEAVGFSQTVRSRPFLSESRANSK